MSRVQPPDTTEWCAGLPCIGERSMTAQERAGLDQVATRYGRLAVIGVLSLFISPVAFFATVNLPGPTRIYLLLLVVVLFPFAFLIGFAFPYSSVRKALMVGSLKEFGGPPFLSHNDDPTVARIRHVLRAPNAEITKIAIDSDGFVLFANDALFNHAYLRSRGSVVLVANGPQPSGQTRKLTDVEREELKLRTTSVKSLVAFHRFIWPVILLVVVGLLIFQIYRPLLHVGVFSALLLLTRPKSNSRVIASALVEDFERGEVQSVGGKEVLPVSRCLWRHGSVPAPWRVRAEREFAVVVPEVVS